MNYLDIILILLFAWAAFNGFIKGFIITFAALVALIGGIFLSINYSYIFADLINRWFHPDPTYVPFISFFFTFMVAMGLVYLIAYLLEFIVKAVGLGIFNRLFGVIFNVLKMALIISVLMNLTNFAGEGLKPIIPDDQKRESFLYRPVSKIAPMIFPYLMFDEWKGPSKSV